MRSPRLTPCLAVAALLLAALLALACNPESDPRGGSGGGSESVSGAAQQPKPGVSVSVSQIQGLAGTVEVADPREAYAVAVSELAEARALTAENVSAALQHVANARGAYEKMFQESTLALDAETDSLIADALHAAEKGARTGKRHQVNLSAQTVRVSMLKVAFMNAEAALDTGDLERLGPWFGVLAEEFAFDESPSPSSEAVAAITSDPSQLPALKDAALDDLLARFTDRVTEQSVAALAALERGEVAAAELEALKGALYYRIVQPDLMSSLGEDEAEELADELQGLLTHSRKGDLEQARSAAVEISELLGSYQEVG